MTDSETSLHAPLRVDYKRLALMLIVGVGVALLLLRLVGEGEAFAVLSAAKTEFVLLALFAESLRYLTVGLYNQKLLHFLGYHLRLWPFVELMFAGGSANRIVSAGGTAGLYLRYRFFDKHGLTLGSLAIVLILQSLITGLVLFSTFVLGLFYLASQHLLDTTQLLVAGAIAVVVIVLLASSTALYRRPRKLKRCLAAFSKLVDRLFERFGKRGIYNPAELLRNVNSFYGAIEVARNNPLEVGKALSYAIITLFADILSLYFVFYALGFPIRLGVLVIGYVISNYIMSFLLMPEGIGLTELSLSAVYAGLGVPAEIVVVAILLFRLISFWLPIPLGLLAMWDLHRRSLI